MREECEGVKVRGVEAGVERGGYDPHLGRGVSWSYFEVSKWKRVKGQKGIE